MSAEADNRGLTDYEKLLLVDPNAREARRRDRLAKLGWGITYLTSGKPRGKRRDSSQETLPPPMPEYIEPDVIKRLGKLLKLEKLPLMDHITDNHHPAADEHSYRLYVTAGNKHNRRVGTTPEEQREIRANKMRQTQVIADQLHHVARSQYQLARIRRAALASAQNSFNTMAPISDEVALWTAEAIEDFGMCLRSRPDVTKRLGYKPDISAQIEQTGLYGSYEPHTVLANGDLLRLVQIEQAKREEFWGQRYEGYVKLDRDRRTQHDIAHDLVIDKLVSQLQPTSVVQ